MKRKYGIPDNTCGIYKITNIQSNECYIGQSLDISARLCTHFGRDAKKQNNIKRHKFYKDINSLGINAFKWEILEICDKNKLLEREQYYFDMYQPTYNVIRPRKYSTQDDITKQHLSETLNSKAYHDKMRSLWDSTEYKERCRQVHTKGKRKMKPCLMLDNNSNVIQEFKSLSDASRYITQEFNFKSKNKVSKIKSVCDGERQKAFGYKWEYKKV